MSTKVQVVIRLRPMNANEKEFSPDECLRTSLSDARLLDVLSTADPLRPPRGFTFDKVFPAETTQQDLYDAIGEPIVENVLKGYNGTVLAYGQTASGKTHSMLGPQGGTTEVLVEDSPEFSSRGLLPRLVERTFAKLQELSQEEISFKVSVSIFELYKECIQDLLSATDSHSEYRIREDTISGRGIYVENLFSKPCSSVSEVFEAIRTSSGRRKVGATRSNETSSRSHCITMINVEQTLHVRDNSRLTARLSVVDLAGSEKVAKTQATGERLKEAQLINLSLTFLGNVIYKLTDGKSEYIPYRDSKLTRILQESFGGNSCTTLLCHCSPAAYNREETFSTLLFAQRAKQIRNKPRVNRELSMRELQLAYAHALEEIRCLKEQLAVEADIHLSTSSPTKLPRQNNTNNTISTSASPRNSLAIGSDIPDGGQTEADELRATVAALMAELAEVKTDLFDKEAELEAAKAQVEFHTKRATTLQEELDEAKRREKRQQMRMHVAEVSLQQQQPDSPQADLRSVPKFHQPTPMVEHRDIRAPPRVMQRTSSSTVQSGRGSTSMRRTGSTGTMQRRLEASPASTPSPVEISVPSTLEVLGTNSPSTEPLTRVGGANYDVAVHKAQLRRLDALEEEIAKLKKQNAELTSQRKTLIATSQQLADQLEQRMVELDAALRDASSIKKILEVKEDENLKMKRILDALNIDIEEQLAMLDLERNHSSKLATEATQLKAYSSRLEEERAQQEFCDIAGMELIVKSEDMALVEREIDALEYMDVDGVERTATALSATRTTKELLGFIETLLEKLRDKFLTSNLDSQRLNLIVTVSELRMRCETALALLASAD